MIPLVETWQAMTLDAKILLVIACLLSAWAGGQAAYLLGWWKGARYGLKRMDELLGR